MYIRALSPKPDAEVDLIGFPGAGGSQGHFRQWDAPLGSRARLSVVDPWSLYFAAQSAEVGSLSELAALLTPELAARSSPVVLVGHSFGALLAYEVARRLSTAGHGALLGGIVAMAQRAPTSPVPETISDRPDRHLRNFLRRMGGTPEEVFAEPELLDLLLRRLRDEIRLSERYENIWPEAVPCPLRVYLGDQDTGIPPDEALKWTKSVAGPAVLREFPGGHFFPFDDNGRVVAALLEDILEPPRGVRSEAGSASSVRRHTG